MIFSLRARFFYRVRAFRISFSELDILKRAASKDFRLIFALGILQF